jgi:hypothetical protein
MAPEQKLHVCGARRRLQALSAMGYSREDLAVLLGTQAAVITNVRGRQPYVTAAMWCRIADVYDRYSMTPGPSARARKDAERAGWLPPLAWDDDQIDLPWGVPSDERQGSRGRRTDLEEVERLYWNGWPLDVIAQDMAVQPQSILRALYRAGKNELAQRLEHTLPVRQRSNGKRKAS